MNNCFFSESFLVERLKLNDEKAIRHLYANYSIAFSNIINKILSTQFRSITVEENFELTKDLLQDAMIRICYNIQRYDPSMGKLYTWMRTILTNTVIDFCRNRNNAFNYTKKIRSGKIDVLNRIIIVKAQRDMISKIDIHTVMSKIEFKFYSVLYLVYFQGLSHPEVAALLKIPIGTVKTRIRNGLSIIRAYLNKDNYLL